MDMPLQLLNNLYRLKRTSPVDHKLTCTVGLSTIEMFWMFILVSVSRAMTWSMWVMSQASRSLLPAGTSPRSLWNSCSFSASLGRPQASSKRGASSFPSRQSGSSRRYCFNRLATVWGSYSSRHGHSSRSYAAFSSSTFDFIPTGKTWGQESKAARNIWFWLLHADKRKSGKGHVLVVRSDMHEVRAL